MEIVIAQANIAVSDLPGTTGGKLLQFVTPQGIKVTVVLQPEAAAEVAKALTGLYIARLLPANGNGKTA